MTPPLLSRFRKDSNAAAAAEMALILPMALALIFTTFEGGNYMLTEHKVVKGVRDGARYAGRLPFEYYSCDTDDGLVSPAGAPPGDTMETQIKNLTRTGQISGGAAKVRGWVDDDVTITVTCDNDPLYNEGIYNSVAGGPRHVVVSTVVAYPSIMGLFGFDTGGLNVVARANAPVTGI